MAPSRGKAKVAAARPTRSSRRAVNNRAQPQNDIPDVYSDMLREAEADERTERNRAPKRRRITAGSSGPNVSSATQHEVESSVRSTSSNAILRAPAAGTQTVEDSSESDSNDFEFEDVDIDIPFGHASNSQEGIEDVSISVQAESSAKRSSKVRRKPATAIEKSHRLLVHELHVLCLLGHCMYVNGRCNNAVAQQHLRSLLSTKTISYLNPSQQHTQFQRNRSFMDGIDQAINSFVADYQVTRTGLSRPHWNIDTEPPPTIDSDEDPIDTAAFIKAAKDLEGSQDVANQLFCAMLRAAGVDARFVCSIQALPFANPPKAATPKKPAKVRIMAVAPETKTPQSSLMEHDAAVSSSRALGNVPSARRRLGQPSFASTLSQPAQPRQKTKAVAKLSFPVFWVEAFNEATQKWVAIDPIVTHTTGQPTKLEPPASYDRNQLTYVVAFEPDGSARDVTWRYAKAYNAKTRRSRVEVSPDGAKWWKRVMRFFRRPGGPLDRDQVEDAEFRQKEAREGLPANVLDFKDHPYYALERHLKRNEVIHPRREVGKVNAGTAAKPKMEPVFRRRDVLSCKSADKWYRCGREIKQGEQPLKHVRARVRRNATPDPGATSSNDGPTTALYAPYQTQLYVPEPVRRGRIPKNAYGNLDIYVPSMVPAGGVHVRHSLARTAAKMIRVDYADAVTGFQFKGRHGTAIIEGVVVADQYAQAVHAVIDGLEYEALEEESRNRSRVALKAWKRFMAGLRIAERVRAYGDGSTAHDAGDDEHMLNSFALTIPDQGLLTAGRFRLSELEKTKATARKRKIPVSDSEHDSELSMDDINGMGDEEGGFFRDDRLSGSDRRSHRNDDLAMPVDGDESREDDDGHTLEMKTDQDGGFVGNDTADADYSGGFVPDDTFPVEEPGVFVPEDTIDTADAGGFIPDDTAAIDYAGGFLPEETADNEHAGGFMPEEAADEEHAVASPFETSTVNRDHLKQNGADVQDKASKVLNNNDKAREEPTMRLSAKINDNIAVGEDQTPNELPITKRQKPTAEQGYNRPPEPPQADLMSENDSDKGSMLSHDPEDDELEPDWLESD
ncbi:DNA repair protein rhp42 [Cercospora beticola]|uniref:DNA repair protein rhp42 n=1 Tax=Cercospora beticola TaxID=122368 RepID=A0A2G5IBC4_CERBT|nr:DNA repair protein rhp42 [Cercospora beticola]PIB02166.1 DNA repair protein rhp42 [Cercospora beticola]WPA96482.1 hypothetical protein RHO25_001089 [Cercospora beticola]CAK1355188.1 unnamed protein product [Cercospora beticola]